MSWIRGFAACFGLTGIFLAGVVWREFVYFAGFPDGILTELAAAEKTLAQVWVPIGGGLGLGLVLLAVTAHRRPTPIGRRVAVVVGLDLALGLAAVALDWYFHRTLRGGEGG